MTIFEYDAANRVQELIQKYERKHHPHPELVEMKPTLWQRISSQSQRVRPSSKITL